MLFRDMYGRPSHARDPRLRYGLSRRVLLFQTLWALMQAHAHHPSELSVLTKRAPHDRAGLMDYHYPWRILADTDKFDRSTWHPWSDEEWQLKSYLFNIPRHGWLDGFESQLRRLLTMGTLYPGRALDDWIKDDSRKYCKPEFRLFYLNT